MKTILSRSCAALLWAFTFPLLAQVAQPAAPTGNPKGSETSTASAPAVTDGIVFYHGRAYVIRGGRAYLIDSTLVPNGQVLTPDGRLVPLQPGFTGFPQGTQVQPGTQPQTGTQQPSGPGNAASGPFGTVPAGSVTPGVVQRTPANEPGLPKTLPGPGHLAPAAPAPGTLAPGNTVPRHSAQGAGNSGGATGGGNPR
jgi:hypothetical protein